MMDALQALICIIVGGSLLLLVDWLLERWEQRSDERWWHARRKPWEWSDATTTRPQQEQHHDISAWRERRWR